MATPFYRVTRLVAPALLASLLALAACDEGVPLQELNRGVPSVLALATDTSAFDEAAPGEALAITVLVTDPYDTPVSDVQIVWTPLDGASAGVEPDTTRTDGAGHASAMWELGMSPGTYQLRATGGFGSSLDLTAHVP